jgi:hypothetical protein
MALNNTPHECVMIAISETGGGVSFLQFNTRMTAGSLQPHEAEPLGFVLSDDGNFWVRSASDENIEKQMQFELQPTKNVYLRDLVRRNAMAGRRVVQLADIPADRTFRNAWKDEGDKIGHDMDKARIIHMGRIRVRRDKKFADTGAGIKFPPELEALMSPERQAHLQELRDIPQTFDLTKYETPEALKAAWPEELA